ncbi:hypothetical protein [Rheinheimera salexigens]|uniref:DNA repair protein n=1 Tax=Rheinheimera salexigens TaxID=1628148 RepID=A0A1E7Q8C4_9GAMM|nr:hypothetical protein [Rheinheimera salexigens]OEY70387.1 hypothetical protein BI198_12985 [Rheinheimera salexigens]
MLLTLIIVLIVALIIIGIIVSAIQQHKERLAALKRAEYSKLRAMLEDSEELLLNSSNVPLSPAISQMLLKRISFTLKAMVDLEPKAKDLRHRLNETESRLNADESKVNHFNDALTLPDNDQQLISMIKGIKKLRLVLRGEHARGNVDTQVVIEEDKRLETLQLRINVESQIKRGLKARSNGMLGSARQYFEKALAALSNFPHQDDYVTARQSEVILTLESIATQLKDGNARDRVKKEEKDTKDMDELFGPKRKW